MNTAEINIDDVVRRVLARLRGGEVSTSTSTPSASPSAAHEDCGCGGHKSASPCACADGHSHDAEPIQVPSPSGRGQGERSVVNAKALTPALSQGERGKSPASDELQLAAPVVSLGQLTGRLGGIRRVVVRSRAIVTPAARDLLKQHKIELKRSDAAAPKATAGVVLGAADTAYDPASLVRTLTQQAVAVQRIAQCGLLAAVDEITDAVARGGQVGVLLTRATAAALCLANRTRGVRAALGTDLPSVNAARGSMAANLLIVDPTGRSVFELSAMIQACTSPNSGCPEDLRKRLN